MDEILRNLPQGARVLDLGCGAGSFPVAALPLRVVRVDLQPKPGAPGGVLVAADSGDLPFAARTFDAVVANHSLEHFPELDRALVEIGRVIRPEGALYVSVPDSTTITDRVYRWIAAGGGHVNAFTSATELAARISQATGLRAAGIRPLYSSLNFLNRRHVRGWPRRRLIWFGLGCEGFLRILVFALRLADHSLGTRLSHYGWGMYFGSVGEEVGTAGWTNVCVRCGTAHAAAWLAAAGLVRRRIPGWRAYRCPCCGAHNWFTSDPSSESPGTAPPTRRSPRL
jgi:SAM-dependent methyltransferase